MKIFLSWSGERSKQMAEFLKVWLKEVIQAVDPWMSRDIEKGVRWSPKISDELEKSKIGIICLTRENLDENWILFEAGALSKTKDAHVCTFLLDLNPTDVERPLGEFQHTKFEKQDVRKLMGTINEAVNEADEAALDEKLLDKSFNRCWPDLEKAFEEIRDQGPPGREPTRSPEDMLQELLELARAHDRRHREEQKERVVSRIFETGRHRPLQDLPLAAAYLISLGALSSEEVPSLRKFLEYLIESAQREEKKKIAELKKKKDTNTDEKNQKIK